MLSTQSPDHGKAWKNLDEGEMYCPICAMILQPINAYEVSENIHEGYIYKHKNIDHRREDLAALMLGIQ